MPHVPTRTLSDELLAGAALLEHRSESVRAVRDREQNRFTRAFEALDQLARATNSPLAIVSGLAVIRYGYPAVTDDIDVVAPRAGLEALLQQAPQFGFRVKWHSKAGWRETTLPRQFPVRQYWGFPPASITLIFPVESSSSSVRAARKTGRI